MSARRLTLLGAAALLAVLALASCGAGNGTDEPKRPRGDGSSAHRPLPAGLAGSVEAKATAFLARPGTAVRRELRPYLGPSPATAVERGATVCRLGAETPSITDPERYPFACIVRADAAGEGLEVEVVLGFVGTELDGACWHAANERIAATTSVPILLTPREARRAPNQISGCA